MKNHFKIIKNRLELTITGFTLIELIGVVVVLGIISLLAFPLILNSIRTGKTEISEATKQLIYAEANRYIASKEDDYKKTEGNVYCIYLRNLAKYGYINEDMYDGDIDNSVTLDKYVKISVNDNKYDLEITNTCETYRSEIYYKVAGLVLDENGDCKTDGTTYEYMGGCYINAEPSTSLSNHVWYNGFLWRIMGINNLGTENESIKMITEENVTSISYNVSGNINFNNSHADNWLNNYFYNKLSNENNLKTNIIVEGAFCQGVATTTAPSNNTCTGTTLTKNVGLLSIDEYNLAGGSSSYLKNGQLFMTMSPYDSTDVWFTLYDGSSDNVGTSATYGVRPVINVNTNSPITGGNGTLSDFYILGEYKNERNTIETLSSAKIGEYVSLNDKLYRVVETGDATKLILDSYYQETSGTNYTMKFGSDNIFTTENRNTEDKTLVGIGYVLNTTVLDWLTDGSNQGKLKSMIVTGNWYQNQFTSGNSYTVSLDEVGTAINAQVGLIRVGEMLSGASYSALTKNGTELSSYSNVGTYWTMTPSTEPSTVWYWYSSGGANGTAVNSVTKTYCLRPVINIDNSLAIVTSGNGLLNSPYVIEPK